MLPEEKCLSEYAMQGGSVRMRSSFQYLSFLPVFLFPFQFGFLLDMLKMCFSFLVQARFFFQQLISGVSSCHAMVSKSFFLASFKTYVFLFFFFHWTWTRWFISIITFSLEASMSPRLEVGKHFVGWQSSSSFENMWFWVLKGTGRLYLSCLFGICFCVHVVN